MDDFALRHGHRYATILINAETRERVEVLPDRKSETLTAWLRTHPGVEAVCRDGAAGYAQAVTDALPQVPQITDRWHLWHNLGGLSSRRSTRTPAAGQNADRPTPHLHGRDTGSRTGRRAGAARDGVVGTGSDLGGRDRRRQAVRRRPRPLPPSDHRDVGGASDRGVGEEREGGGAQGA
ncbi:transposase [Streptomyces sp. NPDC056921]|uniref:transposase n=1 Tax=Streptomyces sp. NPDC056921 TaxID=3345966 RepID=UPI00363B69CD